MSLLGFLGIESGSVASRAQGDTQTVRRITAQLEGLEPDKARYLAGFAFVLARVAQADLDFDSREIQEIKKRIGELATLEADEVSLVVEIAGSQARSLGGTENYLVTREFRKRSSKAQRVELLECAYAVARADGAISADERAEIASIAQELGFSTGEANAARARWGGPPEESDR